MVSFAVRIILFWNVVRSVHGLLNTTTCLQYLSQSDKDLNSKITKDEFLLFLQSISCTSIQSLTANQITDFQELACSSCQARGEGADCCSDPNAYIPINSSEASSASFLCDFVSTLIVGDTKPNCPPVDSSSSVSTTTPVSIAEKPEESTAEPSAESTPDFKLVPVTTTSYPTIAEGSVVVPASPPTVYPTPNGQFEPLPTPTTPTPIGQSLPTPPTVYPTPNGQFEPAEPSPRLETGNPTISLSPLPQINPDPTAPPADAPSSTYSPTTALSDGACIYNLVKADSNFDSQISEDEYINFIADWICRDAKSLTNSLSVAFGVLRCLFSFCRPQINIAGARIDRGSRSAFQQNRLDVICATTRNAMRLGGCPTDIEFNTPTRAPGTTIAPTGDSVFPEPTLPAPVPAPSPEVIPVPNPSEQAPQPFSSPNSNPAPQPTPAEGPAPVPTPALDPTTSNIEPSPAPSESLLTLPPYKVTPIDANPTPEPQSDECLNNLLTSDKNNNGRLDASEYLDFLKQSTTGSCSLIGTLRLTAQQILNLVTWCQEDGFLSCLTLPEISIAGAKLDLMDQTKEQVSRLYRICDSVPRVCPDATPLSAPAIGTPTIPGTPVVVPTDTNPSSPSSPGVVTSPTSPGTGTGLESCSVLLENSDQNGDNTIDMTEYRTLLKLLIGCSAMDTITTEQDSVFEILSCQCQGRVSTTCCSSSTKQFPINLSLFYSGTTESDQNQWLASVCEYIQLVADTPCPQPTDSGNLSPSVVTVPAASPTTPTSPDLPTPTSPDLPTPTSPDLPTPPSPDLPITTPTRVSTDNLTCAEALVKADSDKNDWLNSYEFLKFLVLYTRCNDWTELSQSQEDTFFSLACLCLNVTGASNKCCLPRNARVEIDGAQAAISDRTQQQKESLALICDAAGKILSTGCVSVPVSPSPLVPTLIPPTADSNASIVSPTPDSVSSPEAAPQRNVSLPDSGSVPSTIPVVSEQCVQSLIQSDMNKDGYINATEYVVFLRLLGDCNLITSLSIQQETTFLLLAGAGEIFPSTNFSITSALVPRDSRTYEQADFLSKVCLDSSLNGNCAASPTTPPLVVGDINECLNALRQADSNKDELLEKEEYLVFLRKFSNCSSFSSDRSSLIFNSGLLSKQTVTTSKLNISGVGVPQDDLTDEQKSALSQICVTTKQMAGGCSAPPESAPQADACSTNLVFADRNRDKTLDINEYLDFVRKQYNDCTEVLYLSLAQRIVFQFLACFCLREPGATWECCDPSNAGVSIDGASLSESNRTSDQRSLLNYICTSTNEALDTCPVSSTPLAVTKSHSGYVGNGMIKICMAVLSLFFVWDR